MESRRQSKVVRRLAMISVSAVALGVTASASVTSAATRPVPVSDKAHSAGDITASDTPAAPALSFRGIGVANTTAADPKAAGLPSTGGGVATGDKAIPATALAAYRKAAATLVVEDPSCHLTWPLLAAIGKVETDHGRSWGSASRITADGEVLPTILGPVLNGKNGSALLLDTDGGAYDHNRQYDRAVGPMQFVPATWSELGRDGNGDGIADPNNIWDATLTAASYLCGNGRDLSKPADLRAAILAYNPSIDYLHTVLAWAAAYQKAGSNLPALESVPDPLVLGAGGAAGDDPFGDSSAYTAAGVYDDPNAYADAESDDSNAFFDDGSGDPGFIDDGSGTGTDSGTPSPAEPSKPAAKPSAKPSAKPTAKPTVKPTVTPTGKPAVRVTPTPSTTPKPSSSPKPATTPTATPTPTSSPTPTPAPAATPTPGATPTPTGPVCVPTGVTATAQAAPTATPVDLDNDGTNDVLRVSVDVTAQRAGKYTLGVRLLDDHGWRVTSTAPSVTLTAGSQHVTADLSGLDIGDAGASGAATLRITVRADAAPVTCAAVLLPAASAGTLAADTYDGWVTTLDRLRERLTADIAAGQVSGPAATALPVALGTPSADAPDLTAFQTDLASATVVSAPERVRLDSLAARLLAQAAGSPAPGSPAPVSQPASAYNDGVDPALDGVG